jgi:hypothetical protein
LAEQNVKNKKLDHRVLVLPQARHDPQLGCSIAQPNPLCPKGRILSG